MRSRSIVLGDQFGPVVPEFTHWRLVFSLHTPSAAADAKQLSCHCNVSYWRFAELIPAFDYS
ncbi:hypothetical protein AGR1C_pAt40130 [Agrobacterium fabacearum TT111]|nr:hypothetical protein AGR1C_pAt40130 [Agrobacterium fabacearum TT111]